MKRYEKPKPSGERIRVVAVHKRYSFNLTDHELDRGHAVCTANEVDDEWTCDAEIDIDPTEVSKKEWKEIIEEIRCHFESDLRLEYGAKRFWWKGDRRSPLLRFQKGDHVRFKGGEGEVVYVVPEQSFGVKTPDGRVLNFHIKSLDHFLFKKA